MKCKHKLFKVVYDGVFLKIGRIGKYHTYVLFVSPNFEYSIAFYAFSGPLKVPKLETNAYAKFCGWGGGGGGERGRTNEEYYGISDSPNWGLMKGKGFG